TPLPQPPQELLSTSSVHPTPPPSPHPQPQAAKFPFGLLQTTLDTCAALTSKIEQLELKKVGTSKRIDTSDDTIMEDVSNQRRMIDELDRDEGVALTTEKEEERKTKEAKNSAGDDQVKGRQAEIYQIDIDHPSRVLISAASTTILVVEPQVPAATPTTVPEQIEEEERRAIESINETPAQRAAKRRKLSEEVTELNKHLEIVPDEDDSVFTEATPLARKAPVMDYSIIFLNNKPHYKIIKADGTHQLYISFLTLLKNFDKDDLESLWSIVKERFSTTKPNNFTDDFLLTTRGG
nr:hypothetical protein [Tanacetum cinerariifolium]